MNQLLTSDLKNFVEEAIRAGWPSNTFPRKDAEFSGFYSSTYRKGPWRYLDLWSGATTDMGIQVVFHSKQPTWCCTYRGGVTKERFLQFSTIEANPVFEFLIAAMRLPGDPHLPLRGPARHVGNDGWVYMFQTAGSITSFFAIEKIEQNGENVYERTFTGGLIGDGVLYGERIDTLFRPLLK